MLSSKIRKWNNNILIKISPPYSWNFCIDTGDRDRTLLVVVPRTLPPRGLPRLLPLDLPLVDVVVSFRRAWPSPSLDWSSELSSCSIALSKLSESSESEPGSNIFTRIISIFTFKVRDITIIRNIHDNPVNFFRSVMSGSSPSHVVIPLLMADVLAILSKKWLSGRLKCKDWFTYAIFKYPSGHLNRKFEEKPVNSSDISKRTTWQKFRRLKNNLKHQNEGESFLESNFVRVRGKFCPWRHMCGIICACQIKS